MIEVAIRARVLEAVKAKEDVVKNVLRVVMGEVDRLMGGKEKCDGDWVMVIRKMLKGIETMLENVGDRVEMRAQLEIEKKTLEGFLPKDEGNKESIQAFIVENKIAVSKEIGEGRSMGNVIKALKQAGKPYNNFDVKEIVLEMIKVV